MPFTNVQAPAQSTKQANISLNGCGEKFLSDHQIVFVKRETELLPQATLLAIDPVSAYRPKLVLFPFALNQFII